MWVSMAQPNADTDVLAIMMVTVMALGVWR